MRHRLCQSATGLDGKKIALGDLVSFLPNSEPHQQPCPSVRERINDYRIFEYLDCVAPSPPPPPVLVKKSKIIPGRKYKPIEGYFPGVSLDRLNRRIKLQTKQMVKNESLGEEYKLSTSELNLDEIEHLEWLLHEQTVEEIAGWR